MAGQIHCVSLCPWRLQHESGLSQRLCPGQVHHGHNMCLYVIDFVSIQARLKRFVGDRGTGAQEVYGAQLQAAHHIHVPGDDNYRILQHHYGRSPDLTYLHIANNLYP